MKLAAVSTLLSKARRYIHRKRRIVNTAVINNIPDPFNK